MNGLGRRGFLGGFVGGVLTLAANPAPLLAAPLAKVKELGVLRVAVYKDNRPWSWNDNGIVRGLDVDLAKALADALGVKLDIAELMAGDDMAADLRNGVWKGGILGFRPADVMLHVPFDRQLQIANDQVTILAPYYRESFGAACAEGDCEVAVPQFKGRRLSAATGTIPDIYLMGGFGGALRSSVTHFNTGYEAVAALGTGQAEVAVATRAEVEGALHDMADPRLKARHHPLEAMLSPGWDIAMAVKENSRTLGDALEALIGQMSANGQMKALFGAHGIEWHPAVAAG